HVRDQAVRARLAHHGVSERLSRGSKASIGLPVFVYGLVTSGLPYLLPRWIARRTATKETSYATTRLLASVVAYPLFWGLETWIVWRLAGALWALGFLISLPVSAILAYHYLRGIGRLRAQARLGILALTRHQAASRLLCLRDGGHGDHAATGRARPPRGLRQRPRARRLSPHPDLEWPRRSGTPRGSRGSLGHRVEPIPCHHGLGDWLSRLGALLGPLHPEVRGGAGETAHRGGAQGLLRRRPRRLVGALHHAPHPPRPRG